MTIDQRYFDDAERLLPQSILHLHSREYREGYISALAWVLAGRPNPSAKDRDCPYGTGYAERDAWLFGWGSGFRHGDRLTGEGGAMKSFEEFCSTHRRNASDPEAGRAYIVQLFEWHCGFTPEDLVVEKLYRRHQDNLSDVRAVVRCEIEWDAEGGSCPGCGRDEWTCTCNPAQPC